MWRLLRLCLRLLHHLSMTPANGAAAAVGTLARAVTNATRTKRLPSGPVCHTLSRSRVGLADQHSMCSTSKSVNLKIIKPKYSVACSRSVGAAGERDLLWSCCCCPAGVKSHAVFTSRFCVQLGWSALLAGPGASTALLSVLFSRRVC